MARARLTGEDVERIARRAEAGEPIAPADVRALCEMARELVEVSPTRDIVRVATILSTSRGAAPLQSAEYAALGAAVLKVARGALTEQARRALHEARDALAYGRNWVETLERLRLGGRIGQQVVGLAGSMTKTLHRHLTSTAEALNLGLAGPLDALDPAEPGYREVPALEKMARRTEGGELEQAQETLRVARLGVLKLARFTQQLARSDPNRPWDEGLARQAAACAQDAGAHLREADLTLRQ